MIVPPLLGTTASALPSLSRRRTLKLARTTNAPGERSSAHTETVDSSELSSPKTSHQSSLAAPSESCSTQTSRSETSIHLTVELLIRSRGSRQARLNPQKATDSPIATWPVTGSSLPYFVNSQQALTLYQLLCGLDPSPTTSTSECVWLLTRWILFSLFCYYL